MATTVRVVLGHGASGTAASMRPHVLGLQQRGVEAEAIDLPKGKAERAIPVFAARVASDPSQFVVGGHSYGGRVASMLAADTPVRGLVLLSYPLHRPGHPEDLRVEHWPRIACPVLLLSGESDPFARVDLLRKQVPLLRNAELHTYPGVQHGLAPVLDDALDRVAAFVRAL
jgi:predicted alpha/beta-hydrolase family hydrolase